MFGSYGLALILNKDAHKMAENKGFRSSSPTCGTASDDFLNLTQSHCPTGLHRASALNDVDQDHDDGRSKALDVVNPPSNFWVTLLFLERA
jgi:hypothetical protein